MAIMVLHLTDSERIIALIVPQSKVKIVKDRLEDNGKLSRLSKIRPWSEDSGNTTADGALNSSRYLVPTTEILEENSPNFAPEESMLDLLTRLDLQYLKADIGYTTVMLTQKNGWKAKKAPYESNKLARTVHEWLLTLPLHNASVTADNLISLTRRSYLIHPPMLLLPANTFSAKPWFDLLSALPEAHISRLYASICTAFKLTHVALDGPIPSISGESPNILRSPSSLTPLHGEFGPSLAPPPEHNPTKEDFNNAFWCSTSQNGIVQTWAPRYTMFSRGNLSEKKRVLELGTLSKDGLGGREPAETSAVDLYSGIGYFAFSYFKAGIGMVLCWELNPWSVEGMRRGAEANGWMCRIVRDDGGADYIKSNERFAEGNAREQELVVFPENNEKAEERIAGIRGRIPPIRHINCGFLPTSSDSWSTAVQILDPREGGWIHAHENVRSGDNEHRKDEIVTTFRELAQTYLGIQRFHISCSHIDIVKSYGPGINHVVFDIAVMPLASH